MEVPQAVGPYYSFCAAIENCKRNLHKNCLANLATELLTHSIHVFRFYSGSAAAPAPAAAAAGAAPAAGAAVTVPPAAPSPPTGGAVAAMGEEVRLWCSSLPIARVTRWGGMISTPDAVLQVYREQSLE